jgi:hypothetical protein
VAVGCPVTGARVGCSGDETVIGDDDGWGVSHSEGWLVGIEEGISVFVAVGVCDSEPVGAGVGVFVAGPGSEAICPGDGAGVCWP